MKEKHLYTLLAACIAAAFIVLFTHKYIDGVNEQKLWKFETFKSHRSIVVLTSRKNSLILNVPQGDPTPRICIGENSLVFGVRFSSPVRDFNESKYVYVLSYFEKKNLNTADDLAIEKTYIIVLRDGPPQVPKGAFMWDIHSAAQQ